MRKCGRGTGAREVGSEEGKSCCDLSMPAIELHRQCARGGREEDLGVTVADVREEGKRKGE